MCGGDFEVKVADLANNRNITQLVKDFSIKEHYYKTIYWKVINAILKTFLFKLWTY